MYGTVLVFRATFRMADLNLGLLGRQITWFLMSLEQAVGF